MNSICTQSETLKENISFIKEIQMMMFGLGDSPTPLLSTATVVEKIVLQQLAMIIGQAEEVAERRGVDGIYPQDVLFLMRKDPHKINRIISYIAFKDVKKNLTSSMNDGDMPGLEELLPASIDINRTESKRKAACIQFLHSIGVELDDLSVVDPVKHERLKRSDQRIQTMTHKAFEDYNQSRRVTFLSAKLSSNKFLDWVRQSCPDCPIHKLKSYSVDMLLYLAKETVAQVIDIALLLRQDAGVVPSDPFSRAHQISLPFETFGPSQRQLEGPPPISANEVREVLRRFYSTQLCPWGAFTCNLDSAVFNKILSC